MEDYKTIYEEGLEHINAKEWAMAINAFKEVVKIAPEKGEAYLNMGTALYYLRQYGEAVESMEKALEVGLEDYPLERVYYGLGLAHKDRVFREGGEWKPALDAFNNCLEQNPHYVAAYFQLGMVLLAMKSYENAIKAFETNVKYDPDIQTPITLQAVIGLSNSHCVLGNFEKALFYLKEAIRVEPRVKGVAKGDPGFQKIKDSEYAEQFYDLVR
ncbi:MAG: tetratricopeptide repeat protein [Aureispira sp.]|nr:tetratricopeptide repeat protein [Aureispira sp.]